MSHDAARRREGWLESMNFATIATINPDGQPQLSVVWVKRRRRRRADLHDPRAASKYRNLERDPRATVLVFTAGGPVQVRRGPGRA